MTLPQDGAAIDLLISSDIPIWRPKVDVCWENRKKTHKLAKNQNQYFKNSSGSTAVFGHVLAM
jgi:hypothetical protein